ncbi:hypothetical protein SK128_015650 [Halocaridina rubra]|uniref:VWFC domain-containing protein n=1 Tax=Halocaridina rubra TaxID=373956 RepID=A0AAN9AF30_HALRR
MLNLRYFIVICLCTESSRQYTSRLPDNETCLDQKGIIRENGEKWFVSFTCGLCSCIEGSVSCETVQTACPKAPHPMCTPVPGGCCPNYFCSKITCTDDGGYKRRLGDVWSSSDPCRPMECTEEGVRRTVNTCPPLSSQPYPACQIKSNINCCSYWECRGNCLDPYSFGRVCEHYQDQCLRDRECGEKESCCLVAGCGKECMTSCMEKNGDENIIHSIGESWKDSYVPALYYHCFKDDSDERYYSTLLNSSHSSHYIEDVILLHRRSAKEQGLLHAFRKLWPVKDFRYYLERFRKAAGGSQAYDGLSLSDEVLNFAERFNWNAVLPYLKSANGINTKFALDVGETLLQNQILASKIFFENSRPLDINSPSLKHQVSFGRTDPISMHMANLGHLISKATENLVASLNLPVSSISALSLLGESEECEQRFGAFLRPALSSDCDHRNKYRSFDGSCNNVDDNLMGAAFTQYRRILPPEYGDGISSIRMAKSGEPLPSARLVTSIISKGNINSQTHTLLQMSFGQFLGHDLIATPVSKGPNGEPLTCCDDFRAKLDLAVRSFTNGTHGLEDTEFVRPLQNNGTPAEMRTFSTLIKRIQASGNRILGSLRGNAPSSSQQLPQPPGHQSPLLPKTDDECAPIPIPNNDPFYARFRQICMEFARSLPAASCKFGPREQLNQQSSYLDASLIYGIKPETVNALRTFQKGLLKVQVTKEDQILLPPSSQKLDGCNTEQNFKKGEFCFVAGDGRVNEQMLLTFHQTVWAREHNRVARELKLKNKQWNDELLFQETRRIVIAELQHITYNEYLPTVLPAFVLKRMKLMPGTEGEQSSDYNSEMHVDISNAFATAAFRFGHSAVSDFIQRINSHGIVKSQALSTLFFNPFSLYEKNEVANIARGATGQPASKVDTHFSEEIAGKLFRGSLPFGLDLPAINIQRGRDHGIPGYVKWREHCGLSEVKTFEDLSFEMDADVINSMKALYKDVADIDLYIGGLAERPFLEGLVGPTFACVIADQFMRIKIGDRFWYENKDSPGAFTAAQMKALHNVTLARILCNNIPELQNIQIMPFLMKKPLNDEVSCRSLHIPTYSFQAW